MRTKQRNNLAETARHERVAQNTDVYAVKARNYKGLRRGSPVFGRKLYFVFQGAAPEQWMLDAGEYTMKRFAALYGMTYGGMATNKADAAKLNKSL